MSWTDPNPAGKVKFFNIYKKIVTLYVYQATVLVPNLDWIVPLNTLSGTSFAVTADDGALESSRSVDGVVPAGPIAPSNVVITVAFP
jgi:hypothetical protein